MPTFATVNWRDYLGRGVEYSNVLFDSVQRNLKEGTLGHFVVFTDDLTTEGYADGIELKLLKPGCHGWFNKLQLFDYDAFEDGERIVFFDLDTVITGSLDALAAYDGTFAILQDVYRPGGLQSSVVAWAHGPHSYLWDDYVSSAYPNVRGGDQAWIEQHLAVKPIILQNQFPEAFVSYKRDARFGIPPKASVVFFHGEPRPHECQNWVSHVWKVGGGTSAQLELVANVPLAQIAANIRRAEAMPETAWLQPEDEHGRVAVICAGGPSLMDEIGSIIAHTQAGADIFACNNTAAALLAAGVRADYHVILDARPENARFLAGADAETVCLYASQCDESVHTGARGQLVLWHPAFDGVLDIVGRGSERTYIGGGTTCGMKSATLAWALGYREIHLYGFDSCYRNGEHHAYPQSLNDGEQVIDVSFDGKKYRCAPWMIQQAEDFETFAPQLMDHGVELHVHGTGLIPDISAQFSKGLFRPDSADFRAAAILSRLENVPNPQVAEVGVFAADLSRRLLARRHDLDLLMIDAWKPDTYTTPDDFHASLQGEQQDQFYALAQRVTAFAGSRAKIVRSDSKEAATKIADGSLDLVFIDADHSYEGCRADIRAYWSKVKPGGIISGHDYANDDFSFGPMVKRAVDEFIAEKGLTLELGENFTWFATKQRMVA